MAEMQTLDLELGATSGTLPATASRQRIESIALGTTAIVLLLLIWELAPHFLPIKAGTRLFFTVPSRIIATLWEMFSTGSIWAPLGVSAAAIANALARHRHVVENSDCVSWCRVSTPDQHPRGRA